MAFWLIAKEVISLANEFLDTDKDGDVDSTDIENILTRGEMFASVLGQVSQVDDDVAESEEDQAWEILDSVIFSKLLTDEVLTKANIKKKDAKKRVMKKFEEPDSLRRLSKYAIENELEEKFYEIACVMTMADGVIADEEREFLDELGKSLDLSKFDIKAIEKKYLKK